jgi:hypothetical protein
MVTHPGTSVGTHGLRPLGLPQARQVEVSDLGLPHALVLHGHPVTVERIEEVWRLAEAWWREDPIARTYVRVLLEDGRLVTLFHDDTCVPGDGWYEQRY